MADIIFLDFEIHLRDELRVKELQANPPGETSVMPDGRKAIIRAPLGAAQEFGNSDNGGVALPLVAIGNLATLGPTERAGPYLFSQWFMMDDPYTAVANFPLDAATFVRKSGGLFGIPFLFPQTKRFYWRGVFVYDPPLDDESPDQVGETRSVIMQRRFIDPGFGNMFGNREDVGTSEMSRAAARWTDTFGFAVSGQSFLRKNRLSEYQTTPATHLGRCSWERLYIRLRSTGGGGEFWRAQGGSNSVQFAVLTITPSGQIAAYSENTGVQTLLATSAALEVGKWYKLDVLLCFGDGGAGFGSEDYAPVGATYPGAGMRLFLDNEEQFNVTGVPATGLGSVGFHDYSQIGTQASNETMMLDIGFWMNAARPLALDGIDFKNGSRPVLLRGDSFDSDHDGVGWSGQAQTLAQHPGKANSGAPIPALHLVSSTALSKIAIVTDAERVLSLPGSIGITGFTVCHRGHGNLDGQIGYRLANGADVLETMGANGTDGVYPEATGTQTFPNNSRMMYRPALGELPPAPADLLPIDLLRVKGNDANTSRTFILSAVAECIGTFGEEDYPANFDEDLQMPIAQRGIHNSPYPRSPWSQSVAPPLSPVTIKTGTYVGTGTDLVLEFRSPVNFLWIRRHTNGNPFSIRWFPSMISPSRAGEKNVGYGWMIPRIEMDPTYFIPVAEDASSFKAVVRFAGADSEVNEAGITYCYTAFCDPGMRFSIAHAMWHVATAQPKDSLLIVPDFTPLFAMLFEQRYGVFNVNAMWVKGPGHAAAQLTETTGADVASGLEFGAGFVKHHSGLGLEQWKHIAGMYFRNNDGSGDPGVVRVFAMGSYTGNGSGTRDILASPVSERRPIFILVQPAGATGYYKDCNMPATESRDLVNEGAADTTAITGGALNGFQVGSTLNLNAVLYHYFIIWGGEPAGNGGMSQCGEFDPVPPDRPPCIRPQGQINEPATIGGCDPGPPIPPGPPEGPPEPPGEPPGNPGGGGCDDMLTDLSVECKCHTERVANMALQRVGISRQIIDLATETTEAAVNVRLAYARCVRRVLHDRPWPFATRIAQLTLLSGSPSSPANSDWTYSYRQPADCIFERRIVVFPRSGGGSPGNDTTPPPFRLSFDNPGAFRRILTNQASARLEYTARPECAAGRGDPLFFDALGWALAEAIAAPLTRMPDREEFAAKKYLECLMKFDEVINLGNAGARVTLDPDGFDTATGSLEANVRVVNRALVRIGARAVRDLGLEQSKEAEDVRTIFEDELRSTLRDHPWAFATQYAEGLTLVRGPRSSSSIPISAWSATVNYATNDVVLDSGVVYYAIAPSFNNDPPNAAFWSTTPPAGANDDWTYAWRAPSRMVLMRRIVTERQRSQPMSWDWSEVDPEQYRVASDANGQIIYTKRDNPTIEYTERILNLVLRAEPLFRDAFAWRLAACLAPSLATLDLEVPEQLGRGQRTKPLERKPIEAQMRARAASYAWQNYYLAIERAKVADAREQQQPPGPDAPWITGR